LEEKHSQSRVQDIRTRTGCAADSDLGLRGESETRDTNSYRGSDGSDGHGTLTGYVFFGKQPDQLFLLKTVGQTKKAA
jgi:hypothetical protein